MTIIGHERRTCVPIADMSPSKALYIATTEQVRQRQERKQIRLTEGSQSTFQMVPRQVVSVGQSDWEDR